LYIAINYVSIFLTALLI